MIPERFRIAARAIQVRARDDLRSGLLTYGLLIALTTLTAQVVTDSRWVPGTGVLVPLALGATLCAIVLAETCRRGTTFWLSLEAAGVLALFVATAQRGLGPVRDFIVWVEMVSRSLDFAVLICLCGVTWLYSGWAAFFALRRRSAAIAMAPMAVVLGVEVINDPGQAGLTGWVLGWMLIGALLALRLNLTRLARRWRGGRNDDVAWSVGIQGGRALIGLLVLAVLLPRISDTDISGRLFRAAGHPPPGVLGPGNHGQGRAGGDDFRQTGYTEKVVPGGTLTRSTAQVLDVTTDSTRTLYWRGVDLYDLNGGAWSAGDPSALRAGVSANQPYQQDLFLAREAIHAQLRVLGASRATVFMPGEPLRSDIDTQVRGLAHSTLAGGLVRFDSVDAVYSGVGDSAGARRYTVTASISVATDDELRAAGAIYPPAVRELGQLDDAAALSHVPADVARLARQVTAGRSNTYDRVRAIETYLRGLHYQLEVPAPTGDPVEYFLFTSRAGYCEYFASSMGEMVRSLGIPVRLVNGYGPGTLDESTQHTIIRASDAHTWVEVFFPGYGWVPFEPTPDPNYPAFNRAPGALAAPSPGAGVAHPSPPVVGAPPVHLPPGGGGGVTLPRGLPALLAAAATLVAMVLCLRALLGSPCVDNLRGPWRRLRWLGRRVGVVAGSGETPREYACRLAGAVPAIGPEVMSLADGYGRACFSRDGLGEVQRARVEADWREVRLRLLRLLAFGRSQGSPKRPA